MAESGTEIYSDENESLRGTSPMLIVDVEDPEGSTEDNFESSYARFGTVDFQPYQDEPIADQEWLDNYYREVAEEEERNAVFASRLNGTTPLCNW